MMRDGVEKESFGLRTRVTIECVVENGLVTMHNSQMVAAVATVSSREVEERMKEDMNRIDGDPVSSCRRTHTPIPAVEWHNKYEYSTSTCTVIHATTVHIVGENRFGHEIDGIQ